MDAESMKNLAAGLTIAIGAIGPGIGIGLIAAKAVEAIGRNPESQSKVQQTMILGIAFTEALAIFALLFAFIILFL
ncbi:ATP synthase F0 subunit C [Patescibacteria group bacterium]|nr:MAG: ATP synthase F0 subunit C [Patescibacteria group bacterium]